MKIFRQHPILLLLVINLVIGLMTFRSYGLSWDEPLFYDYGEALKYAYTPSNWFSGNFDVTQSFGSSGTDHANRGPAYLLVAMPFVFLWKGLGFDSASAWHLTNFLTFNLGIYLLYRLASKWMSQWAALAVAALFTFQPLLWGHAFINPKDIPFLTFFLGAVLFGFELIDKWKTNLQSPITNYQLPITNLLTASFFLGIATSIRILGPLATILVLLYALVQGIRISDLLKRPPIWLYAALSLIIMFLAWPYLWLNLLQKFTEVFVFMSDNPTQLNVLFAGENYQAGEIPRRYFPVLLAYTLTEPTYLLIALGIFFGFWKADNKKRLILAILLFWFGILAAYILIKRPAMYDGYRHFLFILPPLFIFAGFAFEALFNLLKQNWQKYVLALAVLAFGILPIIQLHPYQYAYYNNFAGGIDEVFRNYETEYWLTCYREAVLKLNEIAPEDTQLFVRREPYIAATYTDSNIAVRDFRAEQKDMKSGDYYLVNTRSNEDLKFLSDQPAVIEVARMGAIFCIIKQIP
jgi:4-amino-4-deoxy-L-arabinose transferase-like glycosyltransferase